MQRHTPSLIGLVVAVASMAVYVGTADAADTAAVSGKSVYAQERADCEAGRTGQDRATCLKEAGAAAQERQRNGLENTGVARRNATERCMALPQREQADCVARIEGATAPNQTVTTTGSVASGGVLRETRTTTVGPVPPAASAASSSAPR
jgi:hypothetical protein